MKAEVVKRKGETYTVIEVPSEFTPNKTYRVDVVNQRCSCPAWVFQSGKRKGCKHLIALGFRPRDENLHTDPTFAVHL